jgi:hypothetical protein
LTTSPDAIVYILQYMISIRCKKSTVVCRNTVIKSESGTVVGVRGVIRTDVKTKKELRPLRYVLHYCP